MTSERRQQCLHCGRKMKPRGMALHLNSCSSYQMLLQRQSARRRALHGESMEEPKRKPVNPLNSGRVPIFHHPNESFEESRETEEAGIENVWQDFDEDESSQWDPELTCTASAYEHYDGAGATYGSACLYDEHTKAGWEPWWPFKNSDDFALAMWMMENNLTKTAINQFLSRGLDRYTCVSFHTADELWSLLEELPHGLGRNSWHKKEFASGTPLFTRDVKECVQLLLRHQPFRKEMKYSPVRAFTPKGQRVYNEMWTADWWWETQKKISDGGTVIPLILASDKTHLTDYTGDKSAWPLYISIGNISKETRRKPSRRAWILLALLPILSKNPANGELHQIWHEAIDFVLGSIKSVDPKGLGYMWSCSDGYRRECFPIISAWIGDYPEMTFLTRTVSGRCPLCEILPEEMGHNLGRSKGLRRDTERYRLMKDTEKIAVGLKPVQNIFWSYPLVDVYQLWQPDELHQFLIGLFEFLLEIIEKDLTKNHLIDQFDERFKKMSRYPGLQTFNRTFSSVSKWQGKELRSMVCFLVALIVPLYSTKLTGPGSTKNALENQQKRLCARRLTELVFSISQRSHSSETLFNFEKYLDEFYSSREPFRYCLRNTAREKKFDKLWDAMNEKNPQWSTAQRDASRCALETEVFTFSRPKMHLPCHIADQIRRYGSADNFTTDVSELLHVANIKKAYRSTNRNEYHTQMLWHNDRKTSLSYSTDFLRWAALEGYHVKATAWTLQMQHPEDKRKNTRSSVLKNTSGTYLRRSIHPPADLIPLEKRQSHLAGPVQCKKLRKVHLSQATSELNIYQSLRAHTFPNLFRMRLESSFGVKEINEIFGPPENWNQVAKTLNIKVWNSIATYNFTWQSPETIKRSFCRCSVEGRSRQKPHSVWILLDLNDLRMRADKNEPYGSDTFVGHTPAIPMLYFSWTPPASLLKYDQRKEIPRRILKGQEQPQAMEFAYIQGMRYADSHGLPDPWSGMTEVVASPDMHDIVNASTVIGPAHLVPWDVKHTGVGSRWLVNNFVDLETYWKVY